MNLSPLRKQVESLNKQMQCQNIQIKDLINFLSKSTPKQALLKSKSSKHFSSKISNPKANIMQVKPDMDKQQNPIRKKQNRSSKSINELKHIRSKQPQIKLQSNALRQDLIKNDSFLSCGMTKSVTFHNMKNATMTRKYLKLSKPEKKNNTSCSLCKESKNMMTESSKMSVQTQKRSYLQNCKRLIPKRQNSKKMGDKQNKLVKSLSKRSNLSTPKSKFKEKPNSDQKKTLKSLSSNQMLLKSQIMSFVQKKSLNPKENPLKNKSKLFICQEKRTSQKFLTKR